MITYKKIDKKEIKIVAKMVAETFGEYPMYTLTFQDKFKTKEEFISYITKLNTVHIRSNAKKHKCFVGIENKQIVAVALIQNPNIKRISIWDYIASGGTRLLFPVGIKRLIDFFNISNKTHEACERDYGDAYYIELLAVSKESKGKGLGTKMINDCLIPYVKSQGGKEITLITNTENNCKFYEKIGFKMFSFDSLTWNGKKLNTYSFIKEI